MPYLTDITTSRVIPQLIRSRIVKFNAGRAKLNSVCNHAAMSDVGLYTRTYELWFNVRKSENSFTKIIRTPSTSADA